MLLLLDVAAIALATPRNDGKSDEKLSHEAQTYYDPAAQTFALYTFCLLYTSPSPRDS